MPLHTANALILRTYKLAEADSIVVFLTDDRGKRRGVARGARRLKSKFSGGLEPLTKARVAYFERETRDLVHLNYVDPVSSPLLSRHADVLIHVGYFAELLDEWTPEADPDDRVFRLGASVVQALFADVPVRCLARYFEYWLLKLQGVFPSLLACQGCGSDISDRGASLSFSQGGLRCGRCSPREEGTELSGEALMFLRSAASVPPRELIKVVLSNAANRELASAHQRLISSYLGKKLKSVDVLREFMRDE